jgi:serpin B
MNLTLPFDRYGADFTGMTRQGTSSEEELYIDLVSHKAIVEVDERGTEAAAATALILTGRGSGVYRPPVFLANRPFVFMIRDVMSGTILFMGRVADPRSR